MDFIIFSLLSYWIMLIFIIFYILDYKVYLYDYDNDMQKCFFDVLINTQHKKSQVVILLH